MLTSFAVSQSSQHIWTGCETGSNLIVPVLYPGCEVQAVKDWHALEWFSSPAEGPEPNGEG